MVGRGNLKTVLSTAIPLPHPNFFPIIINSNVLNVNCLPLCNLTLIRCNVTLGVSLRHGKVSLSNCFGNVFGFVKLEVKIRKLWIKTKILNFSDL